MSPLGIKLLLTRTSLPKVDGDSYCFHTGWKLWQKPELSPQRPFTIWKVLSWHRFAPPKKDISQLLLKVGVAMQVGSGQWEVKGNDVCDFQIVTFKGKSVLFPFPFHSFSGWIIDLVAEAIRQVHHHHREGSYVWGPTGQQRDKSIWAPSTTEVPY